jgi:hypothetical protein
LATKVLVIDQEGTRYEFRNSGEMLIQRTGEAARSLLGRLVTPILKVSLRQPVHYRIGSQTFETKPLKGCMIDD